MAVFKIWHVQAHGLQNSMPYSAARKTTPHKTEASPITGEKDTPAAHVTKLRSERRQRSGNTARLIHPWLNSSPKDARCTQLTGRQADRERTPLQHDLLYSMQNSLCTLTSGINLRH